MEICDMNIIKRIDDLAPHEILFLSMTFVNNRFSFFYPLQFLLRLVGT